MESATQALYMAFAVIVFTLALSISMTMFSRARATSDAILYNTDETNFLNYQDFNQYASGGNNRNRIVGLETVIPTLYRYYKENYTVVFRKTDDNNYVEKVANKTAISSDYDYITLYESNTDEDNWQKISGTTTNAYNGKDYNNSGTRTAVYSFDLDEETKRNEPWTGSVDEIKRNLDTFINGGTYNNPSNNTPYITYNGGIVDIVMDGNENGQLLEQIGEYVVEDSNNYTDSTGSYQSSGGTVINVDGEDINLLTQTKKRVIIYTLLLP